MDLLEVKMVRSSYRRNASNGLLEVLKGSDLKVRGGEVIALRGASGAGKSTLLAILGGMLKPDSGTVHYAGKNIYNWDDVTLSEFRGGCVGFLFQMDFLLPNYSIAENISMALHYSRSPGADRNFAITKILGEVSLLDRQDHRPDELSGGERHRAALARAIVHDPKLILADEPTGNLDRQNAAQILDLLWRQRDRGAIVIVATHDDWVAGKADRVVSLKNGVILEGSL